MYDPFAYFPAGYSYANHAATVSMRMQCWLSETDVRMIAVNENDPNLALLRQMNPGWFVDVGTMAEAKWIVEGVSVPKPSASDCRAALSASQ
jgi:hypothetical protein